MLPCLMAFFTGHLAFCLFQLAIHSFPYCISCKNQSNEKTDRFQDWFLYEMEDKTEPGRHVVTQIKFSKLKADKGLKNGASRVLHPALQCSVAETMFRCGNHVSWW